MFSTIAIVFMLKSILFQQVYSEVSTNDRITQITDTIFKNLKPKDAKKWKVELRYKDGYPSSLLKAYNTMGGAFMYFAKSSGDGKWLPLEHSLITKWVDEAFKRSFSDSQIKNRQATSIDGVNLTGDVPDKFMQELKKEFGKITQRRVSTDISQPLSNTYVMKYFDFIIDKTISESINLKNKTDNSSLIKGIAWLEDAIRVYDITKEDYYFKKHTMITYISWQTLNEYHRFKICLNWPGLKGCPNICDGKQTTCKEIWGSQEEKCYLTDVKKHLNLPDFVDIPPKPGIYFSQLKCNCLGKYEWSNLGNFKGEGYCRITIAPDDIRHKTICSNNANNRHDYFVCSSLNTKKNGCKLLDTGGIQCTCRTEMGKTSGSNIGIPIDRYFMPPTCHHLLDACIYNANGEPTGAIRCGNTGRCIPDLGFDRYRCICDAGFTNEPLIPYANCKRNANPCSKLVCLNNGVCYKTSFITAFCQCTKGFLGEHCEFPNSQLTDWSLWSKCFPECGASMIRTRNRTCQVIKGNPCDGELIEYEYCKNKSCVIFGKWGSWSPHSRCTHSCNGGKTYRYRDCLYSSGIITSTTKFIKCPGGKQGGFSKGDCNTFFCPVKIEDSIVLDSIKEEKLPNLDDVLVGGEPDEIDYDPFVEEDKVEKILLGANETEHKINLSFLSLVFIFHLIGFAFITMFIKNIRHLQLSEFLPDLDRPETGQSDGLLDDGLSELTADMFDEDGGEETNEFLALLDEHNALDFGDLTDDELMKMI